MAEQCHCLFEAPELEKFITEDIPEPQGPEKKRKWLKYRRFIMTHLLKAIFTDLQKDMEVLGIWKFLVGASKVRTIRSRQLRKR